MLFNTYASLALLVAGLSVAHPGEHEERDHALERERSQYKAHVRRGLDACSAKLAARGVHRRALERRHAHMQKHAKTARLDARDTASLNASHASNATYNATTPHDVVFAANASKPCALNPTGEIGPYYVPCELVRSDIRDGEPGVPLYLEAQFIDVETCEPLQGLYLDIWSCNSTGVYSGVAEQGNGDASDTRNLANTALRGVQASDDDGVVEFQTVFPGHYSGRATHIHIITTQNASAASNDTLAGGTVTHIGQLFFDQSLISSVEATAPYDTNTQDLTLNADDRVLAGELANTTTDPFLEYVLLGPSVADGLLAWATVGVNVSATYDPNYSWAYVAGGSVASQHGSVGGGGGDGAGAGAGPGGNGTAPSGSGVPSGTPPAGGMGSMTASSASASST